MLSSALVLDLKTGFFSLSPLLFSLGFFLLFGELGLFLFFLASLSWSGSLGRRLTLLIFASSSSIEVRVTATVHFWQE